MRGPDSTARRAYRGGNRDGGGGDNLEELKAISQVEENRQEGSVSYQRS